MHELLGDASGEHITGQLRGRASVVVAVCRQSTCEAPSATYGLSVARPGHPINRRAGVASLRFEFGGGRATVAAATTFVVAETARAGVRRDALEQIHYHASDDAVDVRDDGL